MKPLLQDEVQTFLAPDDESELVVCHACEGTGQGQPARAVSTDGNIHQLPRPCSTCKSHKWLWKKTKVDSTSYWGSDLDAIFFFAQWAMAGAFGLLIGLFFMSVLAFKAPFITLLVALPIVWIILNRANAYFAKRFIAKETTHHTYMVAAEKIDPILQKQQQS